MLIYIQAIYLPLQIVNSHLFIGLWVIMVCKTKQGNSRPVVYIYLYLHP